MLRTDVDAGRRRLLRAALAGAGAVATTAATTRPAEAAVRAVCDVTPAGGGAALEDAVLGNSQTCTWVDVPEPAPAPEPAPGAPSSGDAFTVHLLRRTTYGLTPQLQADVVAAGGGLAWLDTQLSPERIDDAACDAVLKRFPLAFVDPPAVHAALSYGGWDSMDQVVQATFVREAWSKRQLLEVMVELWSNHLNITCPSSEAWSTKAWDDTHVVRAHALGRFTDMLVASATSPAMLLYLDNAESRGSRPNENYGRELLELHSVGVDAGYTQADVVDAARAFTGLSVWNPWNGGTPANYGTFRYRADWRYVGPLQVLGWSSANSDPAGGVAVAQSLARYLATHPRTATRIGRKLAVRFVSDNPPAALVERLAQTYLAGGTAVVPVLRTLFSSPEFAASTGQKYRRPAEDVLAAVRAVGMTPAASGTGAIGDLCWQLRELGNAPLGWAPPNGYPDVAAAWTGAGMSLGRWNLHVGLTQHWWKDGVDYPDLATHLLGAARPSTRTALVEALFARLLPGLAVPPAATSALVTFLGGAGEVRDGDVTWLFPTLVALVMDHPLWSVR